MSLDIALLMAGAKERGELESRVTALINEVLKAGGHMLEFCLETEPVLMILVFDRH